MTELEQAYVDAGYTADEAAGVELAVSEACKMLGASDDNCAELRTQAARMASLGKIDGPILEAFSRTVPVSRAMLHRHFRTNAESLEARIAANPVTVTHPLVVGWFRAILRSTIPLEALTDFDRQTEEATTESSEAEQRA